MYYRQQQGLKVGAQEWGWCFSICLKNVRLSFSLHISLRYEELFQSTDGQVLERKYLWRE